MHIKVLGPLEATVDGRSVLPAAFMPRRVFALLALRAGAVVPVESLIDELWGDHPPRTARTVVQTYVRHLRRSIGEGAAQVLVTRFGGYCLAVDAEAVDVHEFERLARAGRVAEVAGRPEVAGRLFREALDVWRGPALVDVRTGRLLGVEVTRLESVRLATLESRIDIDMRTGRHAQLLGELAMLTAMHPFNEGLHAQRMIALYRCGRQCEALESFATLRDTLAAELGAAPSADLRDLRQAILSADTTRLAAGAARSAA
ncbi:AfsR/SARP family transcriptional regulator [Pseudonocardia sp. TRM90224]|uniref:AfsR/SARP family transcriptional regulator n=1 Tax=Pseudonocardia sp. TRM90224 TaxID=2812678 RepID=UPI001E331940|nr:AfsR/SARP family transcriptional regulator [Pseudonocardia sp. TRM90224]